MDDGRSFSQWRARVAVGAWMWCILFVPLSWRLITDVGGYDWSPARYAVALLWAPFVGLPLFLISIGLSYWSCKKAARRARIPEEQGARAGRLAMLLLVGWWALSFVPGLRAIAKVLVPTYAAARTPFGHAAFYAVAVLQAVAGLALQGFLARRRLNDSA